MTSDIEGLTKAAPLSRRDFMTAATAAAAGYTLAAGPVRAEAIRTDTAGLTAGDAKIPVSGGEMPAYFARPEGVSDPPVILVAMEVFGLHEYIKDVVRRLAKLGAFAVAPDYYFRDGVDLTKITDFKELMPIVNAKPDAELVAESGRYRGVGEVAGRGNIEAWDHRFLPWRPGCVDLCGAQQRLESGRRFLRLPCRSPKPDLAQEPDTTRARDDSARSRTVR